MKKYILFIALLLGTAILIMLSGFVLPTEIALLVLISAVTSDFFTTWKCLKKTGREGNPVVALLFKKAGMGKTFCVMAGIWVLFITLRWLHIPNGEQTAIAFTYWWVPVNNVIVLARLSKKARMQEC